MTFRLVDNDWGRELQRALRADSSQLRIVCPFIKSGALSCLLTLKPERTRVITRFNLDEFALGVSDVGTLGTLLGHGAEVRGIRNLHAKMYLFGESTAIITSANLTDAGLDRNPELGIVTEDPAAITNCVDYFNALWSRGHILQPKEAGDWAAAVKARQALGGRRKGSPSLGDFGADIGLTRPPGIPPDVPFAEGEPSMTILICWTSSLMS